MGEKPSLAIITSDNDDHDSPVSPSLPTDHHHHHQPLHVLFLFVRPPCLKSAGSLSSSAMVLAERFDIPVHSSTH